MNDWTPRQIAELHAEAVLRQRMEDGGVNPGEPGEREAWEAGYDARSADIERILDDWYERYSQAGRLGERNEDMFLSIRNQLVPLAPGEPVQFQYRFRQRWLNGTFDGPVDNPDDPNREGDVWVTATSRTWPAPLGRRVQVFLSSVRRRS